MQINIKLFSYHRHEQLVEPLQLELSAGPHVRSEGSLHQADTATGQQLSWRPGHVGAVVHLNMRRGGALISLCVSKDLPIITQGGFDRATAHSTVTLRGTLSQ